MAGEDEGGYSLQGVRFLSSLCVEESGLPKLFDLHGYRRGGRGAEKKAK